MLVGLSTLSGVVQAQANDADRQGSMDMAFIEFLGEGVEVDKEYIDPLRLDEYEQMINTAEQEVKQQND